MRQAPFVLALLLAASPVLSPERAAAQAQAKNEIVPDTWHGDVLRPKPDMRGLSKLRFVTDSDYPPFHYYDEVGALTGFNVDLAKAICETLEVQCEVKAVAWEDLIPSLDKGDADAAIASDADHRRGPREGGLHVALLRDARALRRAQGERP